MDKKHATGTTALVGTLKIGVAHDDNAHHYQRMKVGRRTAMAAAMAAGICPDCSKKMKDGVCPECGRVVEASNPNHIGKGSPHGGEFAPKKGGGNAPNIHGAMSSHLQKMGNTSKEEFDINYIHKSYVGGRESGSYEEKRAAVTAAFRMGSEASGRKVEPLKSEVDRLSMGHNMRQMIRLAYRTGSRVR